MSADRGEAPATRPSRGVWKRLIVQAPFHLEATVRVLQRRPSNPVDVWEEECYRRVLPVAGGLVPVEVTNRGTIEQPDVRFAIQASAADPGKIEVERTLRRMLGLDLDPVAMHARAVREPELRSAAASLLGMRPPRFPGLFEAVGNVIPFQQLSIDAGVAIVTRLVLRFGECLDHDGRGMHAFPSASTISLADVPALRACGLSRSKATALRDIARRVVSGDLDEEQIEGMSSAQALRTLGAVPGIGPWSAALILLRGFGRLDIFPPGDVGAMRQLRALLHLGPDASLEGIQARFDDLRGYLYFYGIGASLLAKGCIRPANVQGADGVPA